MLSFSTSTVLALAVASVSAHSISHVRRHHVSRSQAPAGWATGYLEDYDTYHTRYTAIDCEAKHNTSFFGLCCHPLLSTETLAANRPACCAVGATAQCPGAVSSSAAASVAASAAAPSASAADEEDECDDDGSDDEDEGDDGEDCDADGSDDETTVVASTQAAASTPVAVTSSKAAVITSSKVAAVTSAKAAAPPAEHTTPAQTTATPTTTHTTPKTTSTTDEATTTSTADSSTKTTSSSSGSFITGGFGTWFTQNGVAGACGTVHKDTDFVVALQTSMYANGANCGRKIQIIETSSGKSSTAVVADECPTCLNTNSVDMSVAMFESLAALSVGEMNIKWQFQD
ncbi:RlpA-like double-psi beta-barrel-protein domain-containing protein-containing protein [Mycena epipterygia]|nr:RlpA-like double-psi beta-barrel-protein domain-containing protein-containing protein [Mycena epipterygia]